MSYRSRRSGFGNRYKKSMSANGTVYQRGGANFEVRKHSLTRVIEVEPNKAAIIPIIHYNPTETTSVAFNASSKIAALGTKYYPNTGVQEGSTVKNVHLEIQIQPKTLSSSAIIDFYTGRIMTSFHDIKGEQIYGLHPSDTDGKTMFSDESTTNTSTTPHSATHQEVSDVNGQDTAIPQLPHMTKAQYDLGDVCKHWWKSQSKNIIYGGQPVIYNNWEKIPSKCTRSNPGMFYGLTIMNDAATTTDDTDVLRVEIKENFTEIPLVQ